MSSIAYVGIDIGGSLAKVSIAAANVGLGPSIQIQIGGKILKLHTRSFTDPLECITWVREKTINYDAVKLGLTGGGAMKYGPVVYQTFPQTEIKSLSEFECNTKGLSFIKDASLPITLLEFIKTSQNDVEVKSTMTSLAACELPIQFLSVGSGVSINKVGLGENGFERLKTEDRMLSYDGLLIDGTTLGGGYIFGLIRLLSGESQPTKIIELINSDDKYRKIHEELMLNLMQTAVSMSRIHHTPTIVATGTILRIKPISEAIQKAVKLLVAPLPYKQSLISFNEMEGFIGTFGLLHLLLN